MSLIDCYNDVDLNVARMCFAASKRALGEPYVPPRSSAWFFSSNEKDPVDSLAMFLNSGTTQQKIWSLELLNNMGKSSKKVVQAIISSLNDRSAEVRTAASQVLIMAKACLLYTSPSPRDATLSRMPSSA